MSRALAAGDVDNDGDLDLLVTNNGAGVNLLLNDGVDRQAASNGNALLVRVIGTKSNRSGIGTRLILTTGAAANCRRCSPGRATWGRTTCAHTSDSARPVDPSLEVRWPSGVTEVVKDLPANHVVTLREGWGIVGRVPFRR